MTASAAFALPLPLPLPLHAARTRSAAHALAPPRPAALVRRAPLRRAAAAPGAARWRLCTDGGEGATQAATRPASAAEADSVVREFWRVARGGKFTDATRLFATDAVYHDTLYARPFVGRGAIDAHFRRLEPVLDGRFVFVLDAVAAGATDGLVGARWHAETPGGRPIPLTRGASMYTVRVVDDHTPLLVEAWDFPETPLKTAGPVLAVARAATALLRLFDRRA